MPYGSDRPELSIWIECPNSPYEHYSRVRLQSFFRMDSDSDSSSSSSSPLESSSSSPSPNPSNSRFMVELPCKKEMVFIHDLHRHAYGFDYKACLRHLSYNRGYLKPSRHLSQSSRNLGGGQKLEIAKASGSKSGKY